MPSLDITSDDGRLIADIVASLAAHERRRTRRRQAEGIAAAKAGGRYLGRSRKMNGQQIAEARTRITADEPLRIVARAYGVDVKTLLSTFRAYPPAPTPAQDGSYVSFESEGRRFDLVQTSIRQNAEV